MARIGQTLQTGSLHIFTQRESANLFFRDGLIVAASKGLLDSDEVIKQALDWKSPRMVWLPKETPPPTLRALSFNIVEYLQPLAEAAKETAREPIKKAIPKAAAPGPVPTPRAVVFVEPNQAVPETPPAMPVISINATGPVSVPVVQGTKITEVGPSDVPLRITAPLDLTSTKTISSSAQARSAQEEALVQKHRLVLVSTENPAQRIKITRANCLIGRNPACDITLDHGSVSRQHCLLHLTDRGLHLKDLDTTNGTKVNGIAMTEGYVSPGDRVTIGHLLYVLEKDKVLVPSN